MAYEAVSRGLSQGQACGLVGLARRSFALPAGGGRGGQAAADAPLITRLQALVKRHKGWGFWKYHHRLRKLGEVVNHKRLWRLYRAERLQVGARPGKQRVPARVQPPLVVPTQPNVCWSLDFRRDALTDGRRFRALNVVEDLNGEVLGIAVDFSLPARRVVALLTDLVARHGAPAQLRVDNGPELISHALQDWCRQASVHLHWIAPDCTG